MRWSRMLQTVDVHCAGEIGRVITGGVLNVPGVTMTAKLHHLNHVDDSLRRFLCSEPRAAPAGSFCLLVPATVPEADMGLIILQPDQAHAMSGSNAMCAATAVLETGMVPMIEPETVITFDTAAGLVSATCACVGGKVTSVAIGMPPAFVAVRGATIETRAWGAVTYDLCFGGVFYALVDATELDLTLTPENAREIATKGVALRNLIAPACAAKHPTVPELDGLAYVMFRANDPDGAIRTCTTLRPGRADRSPCGTGSNANMAVRHAAGIARPGDRIVSRSIIGGEFVTEFIEETTVGDVPAALSRISGQCWIYAITQIGLDPTDPFPEGFTLSDTWGG
ncbi:proline racemase family protein [Paracoccus saliphilus]|uniref:Proline racemase n=1 Tax=Paracoccus saliphilus TaxID=405559 RepID=A0AA45W2T1_9RHOB|nr:proline racemase family protein [Paracoccus saliphilus]WCR05083.1 proline racemase family protein [Paracoccus saliphilus]SIS70304.1 proline racemase [Paracoccus saliphilus]